MTTETLHHQDGPDSKVLFGFWTFILSDFVLFAALFASYAVLHNNTYGNVTIHQVASLPYVLVQSFFILACSLSMGFCAGAAQRKRRCGVMFWLLITLILGLVFIGMEYHQFADLVKHGITWQGSAFLSIFFTLVGIHGLHLCAAMLWIVILLIQFLGKGVDNTMHTRVATLGMFVNFLNMIWVLIFAVVYLMGAI